jgi:zinc finger protein ubi-d4
MSEEKTITSNLEKIESFLNDSNYIELIEISATFNTRICVERKLRLPFLDPQTGVAQSHSNLFMKKAQRMPGVKDGQIYTYPVTRPWRKSKRQYLTNSSYYPYYRPFGRFRENESALMVPPRGLPEGPMIDGLNEGSIGLDTDSKDSNKDDIPKEWLYDDMDMELPFEDSPDSDYEEPYHYKRKARGRGGRSRKSNQGSSEGTPTRRGRGGRGGARGRKSTQQTGPMLLDNSSNSSDKFNDFARSRRAQMNPHLNSHHSPFEEQLQGEHKMHLEDAEGSLSSSSTATSSNATSSHFTKNVQGKEKTVPIPSPYCDFCLGTEKENKKTAMPEELVSCSDCGRSGEFFFFVIGNFINSLICRSSNLSSIH